MKKNTYALLLIIFAFSSCSTNTNNKAELVSPDNNLKFTFFIHNNKPAYAIDFGNKKVIDTSYLSFDFEGMPAFGNNIQMKLIATDSVNEQWEMPWGEQRYVQNNYKQIKLLLQEKSDLKRQLTVVCRAYNDGIAWRYEFPEWTNTDSVFITNENTEFNLTSDNTCWWIPADWYLYEHLYNTTPVSKINAMVKANNPNLGKHSYIPENGVNTPFTMRSPDGHYISIHEGALVNYPAMTLGVDTTNLKLVSKLVGNNTSVKARLKFPFSTPWRTITITAKATGLIASKLILNVNEPNKLGDVSYFKPTKYMGIWWEMHLGSATWEMSSGKHGATTKRAKDLIDFASANNIKAILVEGWNTGWEHWIGFDDREGVFDFVTPYPDYNLSEVVAYGKSKGVELIMHHETSAAPRTYEKQLDTAFALMQKLGIHAVKTGYVGRIIPDGEYHQGQWMINHFNKVYQTAHKYQIAVNVHEGIKETGLRRTYPNIISRETFRGQEFNAWASDGGNPPEHLSILAFTTMLAGPIDYTPGIFNIKLKPYRDKNQVNTTLTHQLALYVVIYSPIQMVPDFKENYDKHPAFQFIKDVGVDWDTSIVLNGEPGDFITMARKEKQTENWYIGGITDENKRDISLDFNFLPNNTTFEATIYKDGKNAHWDKNPTDYAIEKIEINAKSKLLVQLAEGGGFAICLKKK